LQAFDILDKSISWRMIDKIDVRDVDPTFPNSFFEYSDPFAESFINAGELLNSIFRQTDRCKWTLWSKISISQFSC